MVPFMFQQCLAGIISVAVDCFIGLTVTRYETNVPMFTPLPLSLMDRLSTTLTGQVTEFFDSKFVSKGPGREGMLNLLASSN